MKYSIESLNTLIEDETLKDDQIQLEREFIKLSAYINEIDELINERLYYLDGVAYSEFFFPQVYQVMNHGYTNNGIIVSPFLDNHKLDKSEKAYLIELKKVLQDMYEKFHSEETGEVVTNLSNYVLTREIINSGEHYVLLEKYIENLEL